MTDFTTVYVGLDIDDKGFHGSVYSPDSGHLESFVCKPTFGALDHRMKQLKDKGHTPRLCYEASYLGYNLCRDLRAGGCHCDIVAPSLIPSMPGKKVKTDRLDAKNLAEYYAKGLLTSIHVPDEEDEQVRALIRSRHFICNQLKDLKRHILGLCRLNRLDYRAETASRNYWTRNHLAWLRGKIKVMQSQEVKFTMENLLGMYGYQESMIEAFDQKIFTISRTDRYLRKTEALECFRGLDTMSAMGLIVEIGDIRRFAHPKKLVSYGGMDITEYSSGGKEKKSGITKMGNRRIRTIVTEACQKAKLPPAIGKRLKQARKNQPPEIVEVAQRCMTRLHKKCTRMMFAGKHANKAKTAAGREMLCFVWEVLKKVG